MVRSTRTHSVLNFEEIHGMPQEKLSNKIISSSLFTCQTHVDQQFEFYCQQCNILTCVKCTIIDHRDHSVTEINKQVEMNKETICQNLQCFQPAEQKLKEVLISGEKVKEKIKARKNEVDTIIRQTFANLQQLLHQREEALLVQSSEVANTKEAHLSLQLEGIQCLLQAITHYQSLATTAIGEYNDVELLSIAHTLQTRANQLQQQFSETSLEVCESPTISVNIDTDELVTKTAILGNVVDGVSPNKSTKIPSHKKIKVRYIPK